MHGLRNRLDAWLFALALLVAAGAIGYLTTRHAWVTDWTRDARASLSPESRAVLDQLHGPVEITSYASPGDLRATVAAFVERYRRGKPDLVLNFVDPQQDPGRMRDLGITVNGELVVRYAGHEARLDQLEESGLTNALERLARGGERIVAFVSGDGERLPNGKANADLGTFILQLEQRGMRAVPLNFSEVAAVPGHSDLVVLASPEAPLAPGAVKALVDYVQRGGNLLWLTDPASGDLGLAPLADALSLRVLPGMLVNGTNTALGLDDPRLIALGSYPFHAITHDFLLTTLFPQAAALARTRENGWNTVPFLRSGPQSWASLHPETHGMPSYDAAEGDLKGPLDFGFALNRLSPSPDKAEQRVAVIGDGDFLSNTYLGNGGNRALGERIFDWLLGDDALVSLPPRGAPDRVLALSQRRLDWLSLGSLVALPLLLLAIGGGIAWRRRRR